MVALAWASFGEAKRGKTLFGVQKFTAEEDRMLTVKEERELKAKAKEAKKAGNDIPKTLEEKRALLKQKFAASAAKGRYDPEKTARTYEQNYKAVAGKQDRDSQKTAQRSASLAKKAMLDAANMKKDAAEKARFEQRRAQIFSGTKLGKFLDGKRQKRAAAAEKEAAPAPAEQAVPTPLRAALPTKKSALVSVASVVTVAAVGMVARSQANNDAGSAKPTRQPSKDASDATKTDESDDGDAATETAGAKEDEEEIAFVEVDEEGPAAAAPKEPAAEPAPPVAQEDPPSSEPPTVEDEAPAPAAGQDEEDAVPPGMTAEAAARLKSMREREDLIGRLEGRFKLLGKDIPLNLRSKPIDELKTLLTSLRDPRAPTAADAE